MRYLLTLSGLVVVLGCFRSIEPYSPKCISLKAKFTYSGILFPEGPIHGLACADDIKHVWIIYRSDAPLTIKDIEAVPMAEQDIAELFAVLAGTKKFGVPVAGSGVSFLWTVNTEEYHLTSMQTSDGFYTKIDKYY